MLWATCILCECWFNWRNLILFFYAKLRNKIITYCYITFNLITCNWTRKKVIYMHYFTFSSDIYETWNVFLFQSLWKRIPARFCLVLIRMFLQEFSLYLKTDLKKSPGDVFTVMCSCHYDFRMIEVPHILVAFTLKHNYFVWHEYSESFKINVKYQ